MKTTPCTETRSAINAKYAFDLAVRCGAKTRAGTPCKSPVIRFKKRCRMHGGSGGSGAPAGNKNALKHGFTTYKSRKERCNIAELIRESKELILKITK